MAVIPPLYALCDLLKIKRIEMHKKFATHCNEETKNCITFVGFFTTNGDGPINPPLYQILRNKSYNETN